MNYGMALLHADRLNREADKRAKDAHIKNAAHKCFVKVTGDLFLSDAFLTWVTDLASVNRVVISIGGGTQINQHFAQNGITFEKHPRLGRAASPEGYQLALRVLEENRSQLQWQLKERKAIVDVVLPVINLAGESCHVDGDVMVYNAYWGFDMLYVVTTPDRVETKRALFHDLPKVTVISM